MVSLCERISLILSLRLPLCLPGYVKDVVMNVDGHVVLLDARELECCGYDVRFFVVMDIHPTCM